MQPSTSEENSQAEWVVSTFTGRGRLCSVRICISCCGTLPAQSLIARIAGTCSTILQQRVARVALAGRERILEHDDRQVGGVGDALEMRERHLRRLLRA